MGQDRGDHGGEATQRDCDQGGLEQETDAEEQEICTQVGSEKDRLGESPTFCTYNRTLDARTRKEEALGIRL